MRLNTVVHLYEISRIGKAIETNSKLVTASGWKLGLGGCLMNIRFYFKMMEMLWKQVEVMVVQHDACTKCH